MTDGDYEPIEDYGLIGNTETAALVSREGSIDWACFPTMNASSVFGAILDSEQGGRFAIRPTADYESSQEYLDRTNVLRTTFRTESGVATITDFMPLLENTGGNAPTYRAIYRKIECIEGTVELGVEFAPRFDYARAETPVEPTEEGALASSDTERVLLSVPDSTALDIEGEGKSNGGGENTASATHTLETGESGWYVC